MFKGTCSIIFTLLLFVTGYGQLNRYALPHPDHSGDTAWSRHGHRALLGEWEKGLALKTGYRYSGYNSAELGIDYLHSLYLGWYGVSAGNEFLFDRKLIYGPQISAELHLFNLGTRLNASWLTADFKSGSLKVRPEIGFTWLGFLNVFYGYAFNLTNSSFYRQQSSITVYANIPVLTYYGHRLVTRRDRSEARKGYRSRGKTDTCSVFLENTIGASIHVDYLKANTACHFSSFKITIRDASGAIVFHTDSLGPDNRILWEYRKFPRSDYSWRIEYKFEGRSNLWYLEGKLTTIE
jgi:hypothetical protein